MKKTLLTLFTTIAVCGMSYSQVYAKIDVSVFENKADYDVDMDDFDDTGEISFVGGDNMPSGTVIGNPDGDSGYISGELDMKKDARKNICYILWSIQLQLVNTSLCFYLHSLYLTSW